MSDAYRTPGREIDETAVETAKIHEAAETQRKLIEEREKTRRNRTDERRILWTDGGFQPLVGVIVFFVCGAGLGGWALYLHSKRPVSEACTESAELINVNASARTCEGGHIVTEPQPGEKVLVKCVCGPAVKP